VLGCEQIHILLEYKKPPLCETDFWLHLVDDVGTKIRESNKWFYVPVLN